MSAKNLRKILTGPTIYRDYRQFSCKSKPKLFALSAERDSARVAYCKCALGSEFNAVEPYLNAGGPFTPCLEPAISYADTVTFQREVQTRLFTSSGLPTILYLTLEVRFKNLIRKIL